MTNKQATILVVDDEPQIQKFFSVILDVHGFTALEATTGTEALSTIAEHKPDLVILDLGLPDIDGGEVLKRLREWSQVPVIALSARSSEKEKIKLLQAGVDDYVVKPFNTQELMARIEAVLRRHVVNEAGESALKIRGMEIDLLRRRVQMENQRIKLTPKEFNLLRLLAQNAGRVMTHRQLLAKIWGDGHDADVQYLRVYIGQLRQKIEKDPDNPEYLMTESGIGYYLSPDGQ